MPEQFTNPEKINTPLSLKIAKYFSIILASLIHFNSAAEALPLGSIDPQTDHNLQVHPLVVTGQNYAGINKLCVFGSTDVVKNPNINVIAGKCLIDGDNKIVGQMSTNIPIGSVTASPYFHIEKGDKSNLNLAGVNLNIPISKDVEINLLGETDFNGGNLVRGVIGVGVK